MGIVMMNKLKLKAGSGEPTVVKVGHGDCAAFAAVREGKIPGIVDPADLFLVVEHAFNKGSDQELGGAAQAKLKEMLENGIDFGDYHYDLYMAGASQIRMAWHTEICRKFRRSYNEWAACGIDIMTNMVRNKPMVYRALVLSTSEDFDVTNLPKIDIDKVGVFPDIEIEVEAIVDEVTEDGVKRVKRKVLLKISDGIAILLVPDDTPDEYMLAFTIRAPWMKGLCIPIRRGHWIRAMEAQGLNPVQKDFEGTERDLRDLQLITFKSVYKACKCKPLPELEAKGMSNWQAYVSEFKRLGHEFRVCVTDHERLASVPYQQFQTLLVDGEDLEWITSRSIKRLEAYKDPHHASHLLPANIGKVARVWPDVMGDDFVRDQVDKAYISRRWQMLAGRIPAMMRYRFAAMDPIALMQGLCHAKVVGLIPAKHVVCSAYKAGKVLDVTRSPHLDNAHMLRRVFEPEVFAGLYTGKTMFFSCRDVSMTAVQMDFDGDHVGVVDNDKWVDIVRKSLLKIKNVPLYYPPKSSKPSERVTKKECVDMLLDLQPAPVGLYAFTLNKIYSKGEYLYREIALMTEGGNTCIDAAKNIGGNSEEKAGKGAAKVLKDYKKVKNSMFVAYAKSSPFVEGSFAEYAEQCEFRDTSALDLYSAAIGEHTEDKLVMDGEENFQFRWKMLMNLSAERQGRVPGLIDLFRQLAIAKAEEYAAAANANQSVANEMEREISEKIRSKVFEFGLAAGLSPDSVVNGLVAGIYAYRRSDAIVMQMKRTMWSSFGDMLYANVLVNLDRDPSAIPADEPVEEEECAVVDAADDAEAGCLWSDEELFGGYEE